MRLWLVWLLTLPGLWGYEILSREDWDALTPDQQLEEELYLSALQMYGGMKIYVNRDDLLVRAAGEKESQEIQFDDFPDYIAEKNAFLALVYYTYSANPDEYVNVTKMIIDESLRAEVRHVSVAEITGGGVGDIRLVAKATRAAPPIEFVGPDKKPDYKDIEWVIPLPKKPLSLLNLSTVVTTFSEIQSKHIFPKEMRQFLEKSDPSQLNPKYADFSMRYMSHYGQRCVEMAELSAVLAINESEQHLLYPHFLIHAFASIYYPNKEEMINSYTPLEVMKEDRLISICSALRLTGPALVDEQIPVELRQKLLSSATQAMQRYQESFSQQEFAALQRIQHQWSQGTSSNK